MTDQNKSFKIKHGLEVTTASVSRIVFSDLTEMITAPTGGNSYATTSSISLIPQLRADLTATVATTGTIISVQDSNTDIASGSTTATGLLSFWDGATGKWKYVHNLLPVTLPTTPIAYDPYYSNVLFLGKADYNGDVKNNVSFSYNGVTQSTTQKLFDKTYSWYADGGATTNITLNNVIYQIGGSDFTLDFWMWNSSDNTTQNAVFAWDSEFEYRFDYTGWRFFNFGAGDYPPEFSASPLTNGWSHFAMERNGSYLNLYLDGIRFYQGPGYSINIDHTGLWFGDEASNKGWKGYLDYIRMTSVARYQGNNFTPPSSDAHYNPQS